MDNKHHFSISDLYKVIISSLGRILFLIVFFPRLALLIGQCRVHLTDMQCLAACWRRDKEEGLASSFEIHLWDLREDFTTQQCPG